MTFPCAACGALLWVDDFERGKAVLIGDLPYCAVCKSKPKPDSSRRGRVPIFAIPTPPPSRPFGRSTSRGWIWILLFALASAAGVAVWALKTGLIRS